MVGKIAVVGEQEYDEFLEGLKSLQGSTNPVDGSPAQRGRQAVPEAQLHRLPHRQVQQPGTRSLEGLYGVTKNVLVLQPDGKYVSQKITVDDAYILESILKPRAKVVEGWKPIMPGHFDENR